jgi:beta-lactamase superfamily II metal-dependent hydrolase
MRINILRVFNGDAIHLSYMDSQKKTRNILIDGGPSPAYSKKGNKGKPEFGELFGLIKTLKRAGESIDLLILTHIDDDHIDGLLQWIKHEPKAHVIIKLVWFNSGKLIAEYLKQPENAALKLPVSISHSFETSVPQAIDFEEYISTNEIYQRKIILAGNRCEFGELRFQFLSPDQQKLSDLLTLYKAKAKKGYFETSGGMGDYSKSIKTHIEEDEFISDTRVANGSSIAFILTQHEENYLFLGDSHPGLIVEQLGLLGYSPDHPLKVSFVKLSHHGSKANTCADLLKLIQTDKYVISTHGLQHGHPDKALIARILSQNPKATIAFNYPELIKFIFLKEDYKDFPEFTAGDANKILNN